MYCNHCGAKNVEGAEFCASCGQALHAAEPGAAPATTPHHFDDTDALAASGAAASVLGHGVGDVAGYMMSKSALDRLETEGQGDSAMADAARTGMTVAQIKIAVGVVGAVIMLIFMLVIWSNANHQMNQFNQQGPSPAYVGSLGSMASHSPH